MMPDPRSLSDVIARLTAMDASLEKGDGVWWFNHLYLRMTQAVTESVLRHEFSDSTFTEQLDVEFARLYLTAVDAAGSESCPKAWRPLLDHRHDQGVPRIVFALLGVNAHINRDLMVALVRAFQACGGEPSRESPRYLDYQRVNEILAAVQGRMKSEYEQGLLGAVDDLMGNLDDLFEVWSISRARESAWDHAEILWGLRDSSDAAAHFIDSTDRLVGFAGRALLLFT